MPQMAPMACLSLFIIFSMTFIKLIKKHYYMNIYKSTHKKTLKNNMNSFNCLW